MQEGHVADAESIVSLLNSMPSRSRAARASATSETRSEMPLWFGSNDSPIRSGSHTPSVTWPALTSKPVGVSRSSGSPSVSV
jgi:hypothetical protein